MVYIKSGEGNAVGLRSPFQRSIFDQRPEGSEGATKNGPGRGNLKDVYQEFNFCADEINFVGFCKMKSGIFLENYGSSIPLVLYS